MALIVNFHVLAGPLRSMVVERFSRNGNELRFSNLSSRNSPLRERQNRLSLGTYSDADTLEQ